MKTTIMINGVEYTVTVAELFDAIGNVSLATRQAQKDVQEAQAGSEDEEEIECLEEAFDNLSSAIENIDIAEGALQNAIWHLDEAESYC